MREWAEERESRWDLEGKGQLKIVFNVRVLGRLVLLDEILVGKRRDGVPLDFWLL